MKPDSLARMRARARSAGHAGTIEDAVPSLFGAPLAASEADELAAILGALADPVRLRLLSLLREKGEICSFDLAEPLGKSQPTISHHTGILAAAGLVAGERRGRSVWWRLDEERLAAVRTALGG